MSSESDPLIGTLVADKYLVKRKIARGGMGTIYQAEQQPLGRPVALKVLDASYAQDGIDPAFEQRFFLEAATCAKLTHPNTVTVYDYGRLGTGEQSTLFMVQEFVKGVTLRRLLRQGGPLEPLRALALAREIARSLREAHRMGVVHRDLKPTNIMVVDTDEGEAVKVLDFGIVKLMTDESSPTADITVGGRFLGTPRYTAPEQVSRLPIDARTDIYALGIVIYEMLTGAPPFSGDPMQVLVSHVKDPVPPLSERAAHPIPPEVEAIVTRCLRKVPDNRFPDADSLIAAIGDVLDEHSGRAVGVLGPPTVDVRALGDPDITAARPMPVGGKSRLGLVIGVVVALLVLGIGVALLGDDRDPPVEQPAVAARAIADPPAPPPPPAPDASRAPDAEARPADATVTPVAPRPTVALATDPPGAEVRIDGAVIGETPLDIELDPTEVKTVELRLRGYARRRVDLDPARSGPLTVVLARERPRKPRPKPKPEPKPALDIRIER